MITIYHHNDMDGVASAASLIYRTTNNNNINTVAIDYQSTLLDNIDKCVSTPIVFIVDYSFKPNTLNELQTLLQMSNITHVYWIDHHTSSYELIQTDEFKELADEYKNKLFYFVDTNFCGAVLTNIFLVSIMRFMNILNGNAGYSVTDSYNVQEFAERNTMHINTLACIVPDFMATETYYDILMGLCRHTVEILKQYYGLLQKDSAGNYQIYNWSSDKLLFNDMGIGTAIYYVDRWDRFVCIQNNNVTEFNYGASRYSIDGWKNAFNKDKCASFINTAIEEGSIIYKNECMNNKRTLNTYGFEFTYMGVKMICLNDSGNSTKFGDTYNDYEAVCLFRYNGNTGKWKYSFFSSKNGANCLKLAESLGGGGHTHAAGAVTDRFIFSEKEVTHNE